MIMSPNEFIGMLLESLISNEKASEKQEKNEYKKYRESLTPVSKEEFTERLIKVMERYSKFLMMSKQNSLICLDGSINRFNKVVSSIKKAKTGLDHAEIIDKLEGMVSDWETATDAIMKHIKSHKHEEIVEHIEQLKKERAERKRVLQFPKER